MVGLRSADEDRISLMRSLAASDRQIFWMLRLPNALPFVMAGLDIAMIFALIGAIVAEFVGAQQGLGVYMTTSKNAFRTDLVFGAVLVTAALTLLLFGVVVLLERLAMPWRRPAEVAARW